jgi:uncharacterized protein YggE
MDTAKSKAEELAKLAGVTLGKPTYVAEKRPVYPELRQLFQIISVSASGAVPAPRVVSPSISTGETTITLSVQVAYSVIP